MKAIFSRMNLTCLNKNRLNLFINKLYLNLIFILLINSFLHKTYSKYMKPNYLYNMRENKINNKILVSCQVK